MLNMCSITFSFRRVTSELVVFLLMFLHLISGCLSGTIRSLRPFKLRRIHQPVILSKNHYLLSWSNHHLFRWWLVAMCCSPRIPISTHWNHQRPRARPLSKWLKMGSALMHLKRHHQWKGRIVLNQDYLSYPRSIQKKKGAILTCWTS